MKKTALVFGGSRGIGAGIVRRMASDGYAVAFTFATRADAATALVEEVTSRGGKAHAIAADSSDANAIDSAVKQAVEKHGPLDVVVINAGIFKLGLLGEVAVDDLDRMLAVNVRGVFLAAQAALSHIRDGGRIITIGSNVAIRSAVAGSSVYQASKAAVNAMVKGFARDVAPRRITVNNVQPGPTDTDITAGALDMLADRSPLKRVGSPAEIAGAVAYLAGDEAGYITGTSLTIDGGFVL